MAASLTLDEVYWVFENEPHRSRPRIFVETGTYQGTTVDRLRNEFDELHTIELSPLLYHAAVARFSGSPVRCHSGDSTNVLPSILAGIAEPVFLFLDAHWSGGETARGNVDVPLLAELAAVSRRTFCDIVVIDDVRLFGVNYAEDWSHVTMASVLGVFGPRLESWFERNDRLILYLSDGVA